MKTLLAVTLFGGSILHAAGPEWSAPATMEAASQLCVSYEYDGSSRVGVDGAASIGSSRLAALDEALRSKLISDYGVIGFEIVSRTPKAGSVPPTELVVVRACRTYEGTLDAIPIGIEQVHAPARAGTVGYCSGIEPEACIAAIAAIGDPNSALGDPGLQIWSAAFSSKSTPFLSGLAPTEKGAELLLLLTKQSHRTARIGASAVVAELANPDPAALIERAGDGSLAVKGRAGWELADKDAVAPRPFMVGSGAVEDAKPWDQALTTIAFVSRSAPVSSTTETGAEAKPTPLPDAKAPSVE